MSDKIPPDQEVIYSSHSEEGVFHTDDHCPRIQTADVSYIYVKEFRYVQDEWDICKYCSGESVESQAEMKTRCPYCGQRIPFLPTHMSSGDCPEM